MASGERAISADLESRLRAACADLDARLRRGEPATAELYFVADPALGSHADSAVELIYTEFVALQEIGRRPRTSDFLRRFPRWRTALEEQLQIHALMAGNEAENATLAGNSLATLADSGGGSQPFAAAAGPAEPGELWLDRYEIGAELGRGGMGVVYQARDVQTEEPVAVKILSVGPCANDDRERWRREAEAESQLGHRHIVQVLALGEHRGRLSLVLELVPGRSLAEYLGGRPQQPRPAAALVEKLARAIHFAHEKGVLHRDLKPSNVLLAPRPMDDLSAWDAGGAKGERFEPKIGDFGLAKRFVEDSSRTTTGAMIGTPSYMAPEQAGGGSYVGPASDVYSLGAVLYELLTGRPPFAGETALETLRQVVWEEPSPPRRVIGWAPRDLETICLKCLSKEPYCRYATAAALADDLSRFLAGRPIAARAKSWPRRLISWSRRRPTVAALGVVGLAVAILLGALSVRHAVELERSNQRLSAALLEAEIQRERAARERAVAERQTEGYRKQFELARRGAYAQLLVEVGNFWRRDPGRGLTLLDNQALCPPDLHDFTWQLLHRLCDRELGRLAAPNGEFEWARFAPDGRTAATFGPDGVVRWWHVAPDSPADTWRTIQTFPPTPAPIAAAAWSVDGKRFLTVDRTGNVREALPNGETRGIAVLAAATHATAAAFHMGSGLLALGYSTGDVRLCDYATGKTQAVWSAHQGEVTCLAFGPLAGRLLSAGRDARTHIWSLVQPELSGELVDSTGVVTAADFSPDGAFVATGHSDENVRVWRVGRKRLIATMHGHVSAVSSLAFSPDGAELASAARDRTVRIWDVSEGRPRAVLKGHARPIAHVDFSPSGRRLLSVGQDGAVKIWRTADADPGRWLTGHTDAVLAVAFSPDGRTVASASRDKSLRLWNAATGDLRAKFEDVHRIRGLAYSLDGRRLFSSGEDRALRFWDVVGAKLEREILDDETPLFGLSLTPDGRRLAVCGESGSVGLWDVESGRRWAHLTGEDANACCIAFAPDGRSLATGTRDGLVEVWDVESGELRRSLTGHDGWVPAVTFSPDGRTIASAGFDETVRLWDAATGEPRHVLRGHAGQVMYVAFSPDGRTLASSAGDRWTYVDGDVRLWDPVIGCLRLTLPVRAGPIAFSPDGRALVTGGEDGAVRLWATYESP